MYIIYFRYVYYLPFLSFISYIILINQSEPRGNFDCSYCHLISKKSQLFLYFVYSVWLLNFIAFCTMKLHES